MSGYDARNFSQEFAKRTMANNNYILNKVNSEENNKLYEVTQLLNSLMGIAVLPYEMNKDALKKITSRAKQSKSYKDLQHFIDKLVKSHQLTSTYKSETENRIYVNQFLRHIRNATSHSGNNAMSILPLLGGIEIEYILFYDRYPSLNVDEVEDQDLQEFAMAISIKELEEMIILISTFYQESGIGEQDKTEKIKKGEERVRRLLPECKFFKKR